MQCGDSLEFLMSPDHQDEVASRWRNRTATSRMAQSYKDRAIQNCRRSSNSPPTGKAAHHLRDADAIFRSVVTVRQFRAVASTPRSRSARAASLEAPDRLACGGRAPCPSARTARFPLEILHRLRIGLLRWRGQKEQVDALRISSAFGNCLPFAARSRSPDVNKSTRGSNP